VGGGAGDADVRCVNRAQRQLDDRIAHVVSLVVSIQPVFLPFSAPRPPDKSRGLSMRSAILPDLGLKR
jgi:hypothetical protein